MGWTQGELKQIDETDDLKVAPFREDRVTYGTQTWIWEVVFEAVDGPINDVYRSK